MADDSKRWLRNRREAAGFTVQKTFAHELGCRLNRSVTEREVGGWERCDRGYRDQEKVPYDAIVALLNETLSAEKRVSVEQLRQDHKRDIRHCENCEQCEAAAKDLDGSFLREAIEACEPELQARLLKVWTAEGDVELAVHNIAEQICAGDSEGVLLPFSSVFEEMLPVGSAPSALCEQIWGVVDAVTRTCVIPGTEYRAGQRQEVGTDQAWIIRIRLLIAKNLPINGLSGNQSSELEDDKTRALITQGVSAGSDPLQRVWELVRLLVERYEPGRKPPLPNPKVDQKAFRDYCRRLNSSLIQDSVSKALFFHLMATPESDEVIDLFYRYLPSLMSFISHEIEGPTEGLLLKSEDLLGSWIARWLYRTGHLYAGDVQQPSDGRAPQPPTAQENSDMAATNQNFVITGSSNVTIHNVRDGSSHSNHQSSLDPAIFLSKLEELLNATAQESSQLSSLRREIRTLQTEIEESNTVPSNFNARLKAAIPAGLSLGDQTTAILNNIRQLWQSAFGGGV